MVNHLYRVVIQLISSILGLLLITSCSQSFTKDREGSAKPTATTTCELIQHQLGETEVCGDAQTIVVLNPNMLELLVALGIQPIGYADIFAIHTGEAFDQPTQQIPYLGNQVTTQPVNLGTAMEPSLEAIAQLNPDLILGSIEELEGKYDILSQIAPTLLFRYRGTDNWQQSIQAIAQATGRKKQAKQVFDAYQQKIETVRHALKPVVENYPSVLMLASDNIERSLQIANDRDFCGSLMEDLGFQLVTLPGQTLNTTAQDISLEVLSDLNADLIVIQGHNSESFDQLTDVNDFSNHQLSDLRQAWTENAIAQSLTPSKKGRVYFVPTYLCRGLPGPIGTEILLTQFQDFLLSVN
ncbi:MAG: ABC transporter substrate-binding protein [Elainellaceae cyanobacterium]